MHALKSTSMIVALSALAFAALLWAAVFGFSIAIDASAETSAKALANAQQENLRRNADSSAVALAAATADGRVQLWGVLNKDALSLSNVINAAGRDAGVALTIGNVTQGPGPALPKGATLHPTSITFSVHADGSFQNLVMLAALLSDLSVASSLDNIQIVRTSSDKGWSLNASIKVITSSPI